MTPLQKTADFGALTEQSTIGPQNICAFDCITLDLVSLCTETGGIPEGALLSHSYGICFTLESLY